jgi:ubiquitin C-terminal hydrolase
MFDHDECSESDKAKFLEQCKYEKSVLDLVQKANSGEQEMDNKDEDIDAKSSKMDEEEISEVCDQEADSQYPIIKKANNFKHRMFGISNIGNTCFFNATMQCLNASKELVEHYVLSQEEFKKYDNILSSRRHLTKNTTTSTTDMLAFWPKETLTSIARLVLVPCGIQCASSKGSMDL